MGVRWPLISMKTRGSVSDQFKDLFFLTQNLLRYEGSTRLYHETCIIHEFQYLTFFFIKIGS